jgi:uncharacterized protein (TIGR02145 family)
MKKLLILFSLIFYLGASAQVTVTLRGKYLSNLLNLDSIIVDNLTQQSHLQLAAPPGINSYDIDLMQGKIINDIPEINTYKGYLHEVINLPGLLQVRTALIKPEIISVSLFNILGKIIRHWEVECNSGISLINLSVGLDQLYICTIQGKAISGNFKVFGKDQNPITLNITHGKEWEQQKSLLETSAPDFLYSPGDTVKFTAIKNNMHRNFQVSIPENSDSVLIYLSKPCPGVQTVVDFDGNVYSTVLIKDKCWMRENIKTTHYADGTPLVNGTGAGDITGDYSTKYWFDYNDDPANSEIYGRYYTGAAMMNGTDLGNEKIQGICPIGWHVSTASEWCEMEKYYDKSIMNCDFNPHGYFGNTIGFQLKDVEPMPYLPIFRSSTNESGFKGLLSGTRSWDMFGGLMLNGQWWAYDNINGGLHNQLLRVVTYGAETILRVRIETDTGHSVRCVKNY